MHRLSGCRIGICLFLVVAVALPLEATANKSGRTQSSKRSNKRSGKRSLVLHLVKPHEAALYRPRSSKLVDKALSKKRRNKRGNKKRGKKRSSTKRSSHSKGRYAQVPSGLDVSAKRKWQVEVTRNLYNEIVADDAAHNKTMSKYERLYSEAIQNNDISTMVSALRYRAKASSTLVEAGRKQSELFGHLARRCKKNARFRKYKKLARARTKKFEKLARKARAAAKDVKKEVRAYEKNIEEHAKEELKKYSHAQSTEAKTPLLGWREANRRFNALLRRGRVNQAFAILDHDIRLLAEGEPRLEKVYQRNIKRMTRAHNRHDDAKLRDQINGDMDAVDIEQKMRGKAQEITDVLRDPIEDLARGSKNGKVEGFPLVWGRVKNFVNRTWKQIQFVRWRRKLRVAAQRKMIRAIESGEIRLDRDLLAEMERQGGRETYYENQKLELKEALDRIAMAETEGYLKPDEAKRERKAVRDQMKEERRGSNFTQGYKVLKNLDRIEKRDYKANKGSRIFVNKQVQRFVNWVVGSPLKSVHKAHKALLHRASVLSKKGIDGQLQAQVLVLTAQHLKMNESKRYGEKFKATRDKAVQRIAKVIKKAKGNGDWFAVESAYDLFNGYKMDAKLQAWDKPRESTRYMKDIKKATLAYIDMLSDQADWILTKPYEAHTKGYSVDDAVLMNEKADARAKEFSVEFPGSVPTRLRKRIATNTLLADPTLWKGKWARFVRSNANPLNLPHRLAKAAIMLPIDIVRRPMIEARVDQKRIAMLLHKTQQHEKKMAAERGEEYDTSRWQSYDDRQTRASDQDDERTMTTGAPRTNNAGGAATAGGAGGAGGFTAPAPAATR